MRKYAIGLLFLVLNLYSIQPASAAAVVNFDFEDMLNPPDSMVLTNQVPGIEFLTETWLFDPVNVHSSAGPLRGPTSGTAAAQTRSDACLRFLTPVVWFSAQVLPAWVNVPSLFTPSQFRTVHLVGYDWDYNERVSTNVAVFTVLGTNNAAADILPQTVELHSSVPLSYITFRYGSSLLIDDLAFTPATPQQIAVPLPPPRSWHVGDFEARVLPWETYAPFEGIPGVTLVGEGVIDEQPPEYAVASGRAVANLMQSFLKFNPPVMEITARVSGDLSWNNGLGYTNYVDFIGYDKERNERARVTAELMTVSSTQQDMDAFEPASIRIQSQVPITFLAYRRANRIYMDDLRVVRASQAQLNAPLPPPQTWPPGTFEGFVGPAGGYMRTNFIPGVQLTALEILDPAPEGLATSGRAAATGKEGAVLRFRKPVTHLRMNLAPEFRIDLVGYDIAGNERTRATAIGGGGQYIVQTVELSSEVPLAYASFRGVGTFFMDDVTFTHATDEQLDRPLPPPAPWPAGSFEGLFGPYQFERTIAARPRMKFNPPVWLIDPGLLPADRTLLPIATSGSTVAQTPEQQQFILFDKPASKVSLNIAPERLWLAPPLGEVPIYVVAYGQHDLEITRALVRWRNMESLEELLAYRMEKVEFSSTTPITYIAILSDHGRVFFDDVTATDFEYFVPVASNPALDGFVAESSENSNIGWHAYALNAGAAALRAGDTGLNQQYKAVLSFSTRAIPKDALILSARLKLKRGAIYGNPFGELGRCWIDIGNGTGFSASLALQESDFQALPAKAKAAALSQEHPESDWYQASFNEKALRWIRPQSVIQLRICFERADNNDLAPDYIGWYSGDHLIPENRPVLEIIYK